MPEGHLVHWYASTQSNGLLGKTTVSSPQGRFSEAAALDGRRLERVEAYGKHLFYWYGGDVVHVHLGMQGLFLHHSIPPPEPRKQVRLRVAGPALVVDLIAPMQCDLISPEDHDTRVAALGPDPLYADAEAERVWTGVSSRREAIGAALLDQALVAGVGNVLRAEALHAAGIHPARASSSLSPAEFHRLWHELTRIMTDAARTGKIITVDRSDGVQRRVYKQQRCGTCGAPVQVWQLKGRAAYACPVDQPPPQSVDRDHRRD